MEDLNNGTVTIPIKEYNDLRDFQNGIEGKKVCSMRHSFGKTIITDYYFLPNDVMISKLQASNVLLSQQNGELRGLISGNNLELVAPKSGSEVSRMTIKEFKQWRKNPTKHWSLELNNY